MEFSMDGTEQMKRTNFSINGGTTKEDTT
jgi:hypothetical protein